MNKAFIDKYDNFIFDLYGTLIDLVTDERAAKTWKKWLKWLDSRGVKHPEYFVFRRDFFDRDKQYRIIEKNKGIHEYPEIDVIPIYRELFEKYGNGVKEDAFLYEAAYEFRKASIEYIRLYDYTIDYLEEIRKKGKRAFILSNAQASYTLPEIKSFRLDEYTLDQLMSSDYYCMKPDKDFYNELINRYNLEKDKTVMVGDSFKADIEGAHGVGIDGIWLTGDRDGICKEMVRL